MTIIEFFNTIMSNFLLEISKSPLLQGILGIWLLLALFNREYRQKLIDNVAFFLRMPLTYDDEKESVQMAFDESTAGDKKNVPLYPRRWFEDSHDGLKDKVVEPLKSLVDLFKIIM